MNNEIIIPTIEEANKQIRNNLDLVKRNDVYEKLNRFIRYSFKKAIGHNFTEYSLLWTKNYNIRNQENILIDIFNELKKIGYEYTKHLSSREIGEGECIYTFVFTVPLLINNDYLTDRDFLISINDSIFNDDYDVENDSQIKYKCK